MSTDKERKIHELKDSFKEFCEERDWDQFHNAKDLAIGLSIEASEILEHFRFKSNEEIEEMFKNPEKKEEISEEMADALFCLVRFAQKYDIDLAEAFDRKLIKAREKYPIEKAKGNNSKYSELG